MKLGTLELGPCGPVRNLLLSTAAVPGRNGLVKPGEAVFPVVHTLYDYDERF